MKSGGVTSDSGAKTAHRDAYAAPSTVSATVQMTERKRPELKICHVYDIRLQIRRYDKRRGTKDFLLIISIQIFMGCYCSNTQMPEPKGGKEKKLQSGISLNNERKTFSSSHDSLNEETE